MVPNIFSEKVSAGLHYFVHHLQVVLEIKGETQLRNLAEKLAAAGVLRLALAQQHICRAQMCHNFHHASIKK